MRLIYSTLLCHVCHDIRFVMYVQWAIFPMNGNDVDEDYFNFMFIVDGEEQLNIRMSW